jgi:choline dehydrogenase-like flavoprotein
MQRFRATKASVMTVHLCSTVPMGEDLERCGADSFGRIHGTRNVFVNDASLLPDAPGVNPQGSVMAIALRNARHFAEVTTARG